MSLQPVSKGRVVPDSGHSSGCNHCGSPAQFCLRTATCTYMSCYFSFRGSWHIVCVLLTQAQTTESRQRLTRGWTLWNVYYVSSKTRMPNKISYFANKRRSCLDWAACLGSNMSYCPTRVTCFVIKLQSCPTRRAYCLSMYSTHRSWKPGSRAVTLVWETVLIQNYNLRKKWWRHPPSITTFKHLQAVTRYSRQRVMTSCLVLMTQGDWKWW